MWNILNGSGQSLSPYAICVAAGAVAALLYVFLRAPRFGLDREDSLYILVPGMLGMAVGAKLLYLIVSVPMVLAQPEALRLAPMALLRALLSGGFVFYGGLGGLLLGCILAARYLGKEWKLYIPVLVPGMCLFHVCGRIGCYLTGCCGGRDGIPVQLMEAGAVAVYFLWIVWKQEKAGSTDSVDELTLYLTGYACLRFLLEFFREDSIRGFIGPLSVSQWISLGILGVLLLRRRSGSI